MDLINNTRKMTMKRYYNGVELEDNLHTNERKIPDKWRWRNPETGKWVSIKEKMSVQEANALAREMNQQIANGFYDHNAIPPAEMLLTHIESFITYRENLTPELRLKRSWDNRKYALKQLPDHFTSIRSLDMTAIRQWWDKLSYHQQKLRMAEFRKLFNYLMGQGLCPKLKFNPFTTADDVARLLTKSKPKKNRPPCSQSTFNKVRDRAGELGYDCLQIAMDISRYTTLRQSDILSLKWDKNIINGCLKIVVSKSEAQKGTARATRLSWDLKDHPLLKSYIDRARKLSLINRRCPFVISHTPDRRAWNEDKESLYQVTRYRLSEMFKECRGESKTTFHEIRGLSATLFKIAGHTNTQIQEIMSHESVTTTQGYQNADDLPYIPVTIHI